MEVVRKTTEDSVEDVGKSAAEDAGKVVESGLNSPSECNISSKQFGKKWGKHKTDYPDLSMDEYKNLIDDVFKSPDKIIQDVENNEFLYLKGNNLLRVTNNGEFVSLYPGAESSRVLQLLKRRDYMAEVIEINLICEDVLSYEILFSFIHKQAEIDYSSRGY